MPLYKMLVAMYADGGLERDAAVCTPWFNDHGATSDPANLCSQLADVFVKTSTGWWKEANTQVRVTAYEHTPGDPTTGPPKASVLRNSGAFLPATCTRDQALCLSFYAGENTGRKRGRLYLPVYGRPAAETAGVRPGATIIAAAKALGVALGGIGGLDVDWVVHSKADDASYTVTNIWVDDEWDTQRRRGLKATTRSTQAVSG